MNQLSRIIKEIDFKIFLTRPYNLLTVIAHAEAYQKRMFKAIGFRLKILVILVQIILWKF